MLLNFKVDSKSYYNLVDVRVDENTEELLEPIRWDRISDDIFALEVFSDVPPVLVLKNMNAYYLDEEDDSEAVLEGNILDSLDNTSLEGFYYRPTALEENTHYIGTYRGVKYVVEHIKGGICEFAGKHDRHVGAATTVMCAETKPSSSLDAYYQLIVLPESKLTF